MRKSAKALRLGMLLAYKEPGIARRKESYLGNLRNCLVRFRICDVYHPDPEELAIDLHGNDLVDGTVIDLSDSDAQKEAFAVVKVEGIERPVVVAVDRLRLAGD